MVNINIVCPICKNCKYVNIPEFLVEQKSHLLTISIPKGLICEHHFQAFVDKNYMIRGYQKVDIELKQEDEDRKANPQNYTFDNYLEDYNISKRLILKGNTLKYRPKDIAYNDNKGFKVLNELEKQKKMSLKDIYNEFWEFIDDQNVDFIDFIREDKRRGRKNREKKNLNSKRFTFNLENEIINDNH